MHDVIWDPSAYWPAAQGMQDVCPASSWYLPFWQLLQLGDWQPLQDTPRETHCQLAGFVSYLPALHPTILTMHFQLPEEAGSGQHTGLPGSLVQVP